MSLPRLERWVEAEGRVHGNIHNDPRFPKGYRVSTSLVMWIDREARKVQTLNTLYELGKEAV